MYVLKCFDLTLFKFQFGCEITYFSGSLCILLKNLLCQAKSEGNAAVSGGVSEGVGHLGNREVILEEGLC
jgi:hypothetical protein